MGVYINMEMPKSCGDCRFCNGQADTDYGVCAWCDVDGNARDAYTMQDCPLIEIPPHGDLIDREALIKELEITEEDDHNGATLLMAVFLEVLKSAPTIIQAIKEVNK